MQNITCCPNKLKNHVKVQVSTYQDLLMSVYWIVLVMKKLMSSINILTVLLTKKKPFNELMKSDGGCKFD